MAGELIYNKRHPSQLIGLILLLFVGSMVLMNSTHAGGGSSDVHLEINIKED